jgi:chorismate mutase
MGEVERLRAEISANDRAIVDAVNRRIRLVAELRGVKAAVGMPFLDPQRERELLDELAASNRGPLTEDGLRAFATELLALTKRELGG